MNSKKKNSLVGIALFVVIFCVIFFNIKIGFSVFDYSKTTLNTPILLNAFITFLSVFLTVLVVVIVIFIFLRYKRKNREEREE